MKYTEVVISDITFDDDEDRVFRNAWRPTDDYDAVILNQLIETVGDKMIREKV